MANASPPVAAPLPPAAPSAAAPALAPAGSSLQAAARPARTARAQAWLRARLAEVIADPQADGALAWRFRAQQVEAVARLLAYMMAGNALTTLAIGLVSWRIVPLPVLLGWATAVLVVLGVAHLILRARIRGDDTPGVSARDFWWLTAYFAGYALLWVSLPAWVFPYTDRIGELVVACGSAGVLCVGSFLLSPHAPAALAYMAIVICGGLFGVLRSSVVGGEGMLVLLAASSMTVAPIVWLNARVFLAAARSEAEKERQKQLVGLLLRDFEEHASDWLWEINVHGRLRHVSARLAQSFGRLPADLLNLRFIDLLDDMADADDEEGRHALRTLRQALAHGTPFRDLEVPVRAGGERRWWSLTAKPLSSERGRQGGWRGVGSDVTRERLARDELARLANYDMLTGLANRHLFNQQLEALRHTHADTSGAAGHQACTLMFLDLDNFKMVNDTLGHAAGDELLRQVARRLREHTQPGDLLARLGGDEFALLSWETTEPAVVAQRAQTLLDALALPCVVEGTRVEVRSSIGIALAPHDGDRPLALLKSADLALYAAKNGGRNTWRFFDPQMAHRARERVAMQQELREAIARGELELHYQPQVDVHTGAVCGFEALLRWTHPQRGPIGPGDFVPLAEETGEIIGIGAWALRRACEEALGWPEDMRVAVNLSAVQFRGTEVPDLVAEVLRETGLPAHRLELEITESALIEDKDLALATLHALRQQGVRVALDDFGTGYSSLAYLRTFPLDKLKIDGMFVRALDGDDDAREVVRAIISLSRALRLDTTAEGVETEGQLGVLRALGCRDVQGFLLARPMAASAIPAYLAVQRSTVSALRH